MELSLFVLVLGRTSFLGPGVNQTMHTPLKMETITNLKKFCNDVTFLKASRMVAFSGGCVKMRKVSPVFANAIVARVVGKRGVGRAVGLGVDRAVIPVRRRCSYAYIYLHYSLSKYDD